MKITLQLLKNTMKVAKHTKLPQSSIIKIKNKATDISIIETYYPTKNKKDDIFPYWKLEMKEEQYFITLYVYDLKEVRDISNGFINQGNKSYLETILPNY